MDYLVDSSAGFVVGVFDGGHFRRLSEFTANMLAMAIVRYVTCACPVGFLGWPADPGGLLVLWSMQDMTICTM